MNKKITACLRHDVESVSCRRMIKKANTWSKLQAKYLHRDFSEIDSFQATQEDFNKAFVRTKTKSSYLLILPAFIWTFLKKLFKRYGLKRSLYLALYKSMLIYQYRKQSEK
jgi:hypothetical protein